jgi:hypothetical protein
MTADRPSSWKRPALLLGLLTFLFCLPLLWRALAPVQFDSDEGWNVVRALMTTHHVPLYGAPPVLDFTNYPFLSFHLIGWMSALGLDPLFAGRGLALAALVVLGGFAGAFVRLFTPDRHAALFAGFLFVLWLAIWMPDRVAVDDPQLFGMVFEAAGFYVFIRNENSDVMLWLSAALFVLALFTKQNLVALPIGAGLSLILQRRWSGLLHWLLAGALCGGLLLWLTFRVDGLFFFANLLQPRAYIWRDFGSQSGDYLLVFLPILALAGIWCWRHRREARAWPFILAWIAANFLGLAFSGGDGVGRNVFFEAVLLSVVLATASCAAAPRSWRGLLLLFPLVWAPAHLIATLQEVEDLPHARADFAAGVALLKTVPGPVACENLLLCARAGHVPAFSTYYVQSQIRLHRLPEAAVTSMVAERLLQAVEIGTTDQPEAPRRVQFSPEFLAALRAHYRLALRERTVSIWTPVLASGP